MHLARFQRIGRRLFLGCLGAVACLLMTACGSLPKPPPPLGNAGGTAPAPKPSSGPLAGPVGGALPGGQSVLVYLEDATFQTSWTGGLRVRIDLGKVPKANIGTVEFVAVYERERIGKLGVMKDFMTTGSKATVHDTTTGNRLSVRVEQITLDESDGTANPSVATLTLPFLSDSLAGSQTRIELESVRVLDRSGQSIPASGRGATVKFVPLKV